MAGSVDEAMAAVEEARGEHKALEDQVAHLTKEFGVVALNN